MQNIIFMDDDLNRTAEFLKRTHSTDTAINGRISTPTTANGAIDCIKAINATRGQEENSLLLFLDHDLGGEIYVDSNREDCGMEVVRWIEANKPVIEDIIVHTHNTPAGMEMHERLNAAGYSVRYIPFAYLLDQIRG